MDFLNFKSLKYLDDKKKEAAENILQTLSGFNNNEITMILDCVRFEINNRLTFNFSLCKEDYKSPQSSAYKAEPTAQS